MNSSNTAGGASTSRRPALARLMARVVEMPGSLETPCWVPTYAVNYKGYGVMNGDDGRKTTCHRVAYLALVGTIGVGLCIDHLCRNRRCCNPAHLEPVTVRENLMRGQAPTILLHLANVCKYGHSLGDAYIYPATGFRSCRICRRTRERSRDKRVAA